MRRAAFFVTLTFAIGGLFFASAKLLLLSLGETTEGRITRVLDQEVETEIRRQRRSASRATGYFRIDVDVAYTFDVLPSTTEALKRASTAPLRKEVAGEDTLHWKARDADAEPFRVGQSLRILFLRTYPAWNRAHQPGTLRGEIATWSGAGLVLAAAAFFLRPRRDRTPQRTA